MNGSVVFSNDAPPPSLANATSSTATRPSSLAAGGSVRGVRNAKRGRVGGGLLGKVEEDSRLSWGRSSHMQKPKLPPPADWQAEPAGQSVPVMLQVLRQVDVFPIVIQRYPATQELMTLQGAPGIFVPLQSQIVELTVLSK